MLIGGINCTPIYFIFDDFFSLLPYLFCELPYWGGGGDTNDFINIFFQCFTFNTPADKVWRERCVAPVFPKLVSAQKHKKIYDGF